VTFAQCGDPKWQRLPAAAAEAGSRCHFSGIPTQPELLTTLTCFKGRTRCHFDRGEKSRISSIIRGKNEGRLEGATCPPCIEKLRNLLRQESLSFPELLSRYLEYLVRSAFQFFVEESQVPAGRRLGLAAQTGLDETLCLLLGAAFKMVEGQIQIGS